MRQFSTIHHATDKLGLARMLEEFANDQWIGEHYSDEQACELLLDRFKKLVEAELEIVEVEIIDTLALRETIFGSLSIDPSALSL